MGYLTLVFLVFATVFGICKCKNIYNPITLFFGYWTCLILLAILHLYNFYELSTSTFFLLFIGLLSVFLGIFVGGKKRIVIRHNSVNLKYTYNTDIMILINSLILIFIVIRVLVLLELIASGYSWWNIRLIASGNDGENFSSYWGSSIVYNIYTYIIAPIIYMEAPMLIVMIYNKKYRYKRLVILLLINFGLFSVMTVSRNLMSFLVVYFIVGFFIFNKHKDPKVRNSIKKFKKFIPLVILILIAAIWKISTLRNTEENILETLYIYMVGGLPSLEYRIDHYSYPTYTFGLYTLRGFIRPILMVFHIFGFGDPSIYQTVVQIASDCELYVPIGTNVRMNAYATIFYSLFRDGGYIGIIIGSLLFGWLMKISYNSMKRRDDLRSYVIYFLIIQQIFFSMARFYFVFPTRAFSYVWAFILLSYSEKNIKNDN